ncbi:MAG: hypothetical protein F6K50_33110 [Moorea sp. SIO3I7]|uniref:hypothetical protein n=2 Tax=Moorena TaxID=1155738 RepID=UPI0013C12213|nr:MULTISPECIES: hypothetical protein [unclassified Moorena]NEO00131.1 hypothetical protein [Moorena sp. SIO3I7]NEO06215.1 hypothetical protein [Moorena sp. SIO3I8]NEO19310.1 hypothetical protein [Moorena sp. SIO4A5]NEP20547.1 hypothetical protein [Moorena sp. SIO3I6]
MGRWGDGEMGRWGDGEMGRWGDGEMGEIFIKGNYSVYRSYEVQSSFRLIPCIDAAHCCSLFPIPYSLFPIPYSLFPIPYSLFPVP